MKLNDNRAEKVSGRRLPDLMMAVRKTLLRLSKVPPINTLAKFRPGRVLQLSTRADISECQGSMNQRVLDALPSSIAVLDADGVIVTVNQAWRKFGAENAYQGPSHGIGASYLGVCDHASGEDAALGHQAALGIRSVLGGTTRLFSTKYPCHSPTTQRWFWMTVLPLGEKPGSGAVVVHENVTERNDVEYQMHRLANYDPTTCLPNRILFNETLRHVLAQARSTNAMVAVLFIDLDHFKKVNDTLGYALGDHLLSQFGKRLLASVDLRDTLGRLGGDEFCVISTLKQGKHGASSLAEKIQAALKAPFDLECIEISVTASIGITIFPEDGLNADTLIRYADTAMRRAKHGGRDTFRFFTDQMNIEVTARLNLERALRLAVEREEFVLYYQPKVDLSSGRIAGLEALLRWRRPGFGLVLPKDFIAAMEEMGLLVEVGRWIIGTACEQISKWAGSPVGLIQVSVNVAAGQFIAGNLDEDISRALAANNIDPSLLELELTESSLMLNTDRTISTMKNLQECGVLISIDDFGTGYSSLAYLRRFPIDKLKIDIAFIREVTTNRDDAAIVFAIIQMAHSLDLRAIAEGVETEAQLVFLKDHGCDEIQGYIYSAAVSASAVEHMLLAQKL
jgi:diguanylate cyclase (GGDEF)-like protein